MLVYIPDTMEKQLKALVLLLCVFLFYHDVCVVAMSAARKLDKRNPYEDDLKLLGRRPGNDVKREVRSSSDRLLEVLQSEGYNTSNMCADWQEFDGTTCICSNRCSANSDINMGIVCDDNGNRHPNLCEFTYKKCSEQVSITVNLVSCGVCNTLKLAGSRFYPEGNVKGHGIFYKETSGNVWTAADDGGHVLKLFFSEEIGKWVIGSADMRSAGIVFISNTTYPQDSNQGAVIMLNQTYGQQDAFLHLECISDTNNPRIGSENTRVQRAVALVALAAVGVVASISSITVTTIQKEKGCLFTKEVCRLKKDTDRLKPEVEILQKRYESIIGDPMKLRDVVHKCFQNLMTLKDKMVELKKLEDEFNNLSERIGDKLEYLSPEIAQSFDTSFHDKWLKALESQQTWGIIGLIYVQMPLEMLSVIGATASKGAIAFAALGAALSVAAAATTIILSYKNEISQRDELRKVKRDLVEAKEKLTDALSNVKSFQKEFYKSVIYPMKKFTHHMRNYDNIFYNLYSYLKTVYGSSLSETVSESTYAKVTSNSIQVLSSRKLTFLLSYLSYKIKDLEQKIKSFKATDNLINLIERSVLEQLYPEDILQVAQRVLKDYADKMVPDEYRLLRFISDKVLMTRNCYWGYNLNDIRNGVLTSSNYKSEPLCNSPELIKIEESVQQYTAQNLSPHQIVLRVQHKRFISKYQKLKFLADFILPSKPCYWGYNLNLIRQNKISEPELNEANPTQPSFTSMKTLADDVLPDAMCKVVKICNSEWQAYVQCLLKFYNGSNMCKGAKDC